MSLRLAQSHLHKYRISTALTRFHVQRLAKVTMVLLLDKVIVGFPRSCHQETEWVSCISTAAEPHKINAI